MGIKLIVTEIHKLQLRDTETCQNLDVTKLGRKEMSGCGGSLVDSSPFVRRVAGSNPALATK